jgi:Flp pilus assembly protein TadG
MSIIKNVLNLKKSSRGSALVEFALIFPILVTLLTGIFELCMMLLLDNKLIRLSGTMSDIITMQNANIARIQAILATADDITAPFIFTGNGGIVVSQIYNNGQTQLPAKMLMSWQQSTGGAVSKIGTPGKLPTNIPNNYQVLGTNTIVVTEVFYNYKPIIFSGIIPSKVIYHVSMYPPRIGDMTTLLP